jgi:hypothetical protein
MSSVWEPMIHVTDSLHGGVVSEPVYWIISFDVRNDSKSANCRAPVSVALPGTAMAEMDENTAPRRWFVVSASSIRMLMTARDLSALTVRLVGFDEEIIDLGRLEMCRFALLGL